MIIPESILTAAEATLALEASQGEDLVPALRRAVLAALISYRRHLHVEIAAKLVAMAEELDKDDTDELAYDGPGALLMMAAELEGEMPLDDISG